MTSSGSTFVRRQLGARLRKLRNEAGKSQADVAAASIVSEVTLWRIEAGVTSVKWPMVKSLCELYGTDMETAHALVDLAKASKGTGWFERHGDVVPQRLGIYLGAEQAASKISAYEAEVIFGTLQTADYAAALFRGEHPRDSAERIDQLVEVRMERQQRFWTARSNDARLAVVLNEAALAREVGSRATMSAQVDHLRALDGERGLEIRVLPWSAGAHPAIYGGCTVLEFPHPEDPTVVYVNNYTGGQYLEEARDVTRMLDVLQRVFNAAQPIKEYART